MSSSVDNLHPGFAPRRDDLGPATPVSPFASFVRKRSYPAMHMGKKQQQQYSSLEGAHDPESAASHANGPQNQLSDSPPSYAPASGHVLPTSGYTPTLRDLNEKDPNLQHDSDLQHEPTMGERLTFYQRHFTKPVNKDGRNQDSNNRRFSFFSCGAIISGIVMLLLLFGVIAAAVALTIDRRPQAHSKSRPAPAVTGNYTGTPIRSAIFDNFPDPSLWYNDGTYYAFATNNVAGILQQPQNASNYKYGTSNVQLATSNDFVNWTLLPSTDDPLPKTGQWVVQGMTEANPLIPKAGVWAPAVIQRATDKKFVLYYSAVRASADNGTRAARVPADDGNHPPPHCIGAAVSESDDPAGIYKPLDDFIACPIDDGGAIDPAGFQDNDGSLWLTYKVDGNNIGHGGVCGNTKAPIVPTPIKLQKMHADGTTRDGNATTILNRIKVDGPLVEAPALMRTHEGIYFLFFSSGCTRSPTYNIKYATALNITGPYVRAGAPLLATGDWGLEAPGSVGVHDDGSGGFNMVFHARVSAPQGRIRAMFTTKLEFTGHKVRMVRSNGTITQS